MAAIWIWPSDGERNSIEAPIRTRSLIHGNKFAAEFAIQQSLLNKPQSGQMAERFVEASESEVKRQKAKQIFG